MYLLCMSIPIWLIYRQDNAGYVTVLQRYSAAVGGDVSRVLAHVLQRCSAGSPLRSCTADQLPHTAAAELLARASSANSCRPAPAPPPRLK